MSDTAAFYDAIYQKNPRKWSSVDRDYLAFKIMSDHPEPARLLDFGCGNGHTLVFFKIQWLNTQMTGVDISPVALELARQRVPDGEFYTALPDGAWDVILCMGVAEHFDNPAKELKVLGERLLPGGRLYLEAPNCLAYSPDKTEGFRKTHAGADQLEWHWRRESWERVIWNAGLEIVKGYAGGVPAWEFIWVLRRSE